ncbi:MAG: L,D-transpeptidase family protein [Chloroflexi bacterium]|nr:L,D-transpeptidase family protein [Chloroflexota bacterium]
MSARSPSLVRRALALASAVAMALTIDASVGVPAARADGWWAQTLRPVELWSGPDGDAQSFGELPRGAYLFVTPQQPFPGRPRLYVEEPIDRAYGYVDAIILAPSGPPPGRSDARESNAAAAVVGAPLFLPFWVANHVATSLWASPTPGGDAAGDLPQFSKLLVFAPPSGDRYYVQDARTERLGYVDVAVVGPSEPPGPEDIPVVQPAAEPSFVPWWVAAHRPAELWSSVDGGSSFGRVAVGEHFLVMAPQDGPRLHVLNPKTKNYAFVDALAVGPSDGPAAASIEVRGWRGLVTGDVVNLRPEPHTFIAPQGEVRAGDEISVNAWVEGEELDKDNRTWARIAGVRRPDSRGTPVDVPLGVGAGPLFIYSGLLRPVRVQSPPEPPKTNLGAGGARWIDVNLSLQIVTAYEGDRSVYMAPTTSGRPGWETPTGIFRIQRRVQNETMIGSTLLRLDTLEIPDYRLENVKWTQYFTNGGAAIHTNYWRPTGLFGMPSSHGCLGMLEEHAKWYWNWARVGTPLLIHY